MHHIDVYRTEVGQKWTCKWFLEGTSLGHLRSHHGARVHQEDQKRAPFGTTRPSMITEALMLRVQCPGKKKWQKSQLPLGLPEKSEDTTLENGFPTKMLLQEPN
jgi:hypothetical protein